jgi:hypothetical protein
VLEEVGEAGAAHDLVLRADVIPDVDRDARRAAIRGEDDGQAVRELVPLEGNVDRVARAIGLLALGDGGCRGGDERRGEHQGAEDKTHGTCGVKERFGDPDDGRGRGEMQPRRDEWSDGESRGWSVGS